MLNSSNIRDGLLNGRIRLVGTLAPNPFHMPFREALAAATIDDLLYAAKLLVEHPKAKRTHRKQRTTEIAQRLDEARRGVAFSPPPPPVPLIAMTPERIQALSLYLDTFGTYLGEDWPELGAAYDTLRAMLTELGVDASQNT